MTKICSSTLSGEWTDNCSPGCTTEGGINSIIGDGFVGTACSGTVENASSAPNHDHLTRTQLMTLCERRPICHFVELADRSLYQALLETIIADSLQTLTPTQLQGIRLMLQHLEVTHICDCSKL
ncbi:unnamed protein product [Protopolystoma xenopodis]|uniref:RFX1-4/6/8-like BCD domain-containing protein n=1 Tax=Protopolystoma xenopodis TaxID=117903 RepID=A0A448WK54_9PLAT|nr:unnamed protein product [Protopolystoma xenopodis]